ncbi:hypothetical protein BGZ63DRAFT_326553, partial [Mariannaea sp. PMI_226]
ALVGVSWTISTPPSGLHDIAFPMKATKAPHRTGYFFAQQFGFKGSNDVGYIGLQPRNDQNGRSILHAVFSSFVAGTTTTDANCQSGADGGPGVSCGTEIAVNYDDEFNLVVTNVRGTTWEGTLVNQATQRKTHIGSWVLPAETGGITSSQTGFVEYYPWNDGASHSCNNLPFTQISFGNPFSSSGSGKVGQPYEYGDCVGKVAFMTDQLSDGYKVKVGF